MPGTAKHWDSKRYTVYRDQFVKTQLCRYYAAGICSKGADCKFAHGKTELGETPDLRKTALCEDFKKGKCPLPSHECIYAHGQDELRSSDAFQAMRKDTASTPPSAAVEIQRSIRLCGVFELSRTRQDCQCVLRRRQRANSLSSGRCI
eukprot:TRINITY_DN12934_c0_g1_i1.p1 TRINITY_DN12934_c0_g1~~TRINITY_DN12934_c0_g1_i1.p1  ORF type:complete len:148 (+),score=16.28 TRINITY_DN12934_c0_g1_i1:114-557(+)